VVWSNNFSGDAILSVRGFNDCGETDIKPIAINGEPAPYVTAMDDITICEGESVVLTVRDSNGTLDWDVNDLVVYPLEETTYRVTATNLCGEAEDRVVVSVNKYPSLSV